jgi:hypothetical protein
MQGMSECRAVRLSYACMRVPPVASKTEHEAVTGIVMSEISPSCSLGIGLRNSWCFTLFCFLMHEIFITTGIRTDTYNCPAGQR